LYSTIIPGATDATETLAGFQSVEWIIKEFLNRILDVDKAREAIQAQTDECRAIVAKRKKQAKDYKNTIVPTGHKKGER